MFLIFSVVTTLNFCNGFSPKLDSKPTNFPFYRVFFCLRDNFLIWFLGNHWDSIQNRRDFFDQIAVEHNFDPLIASNWYSAELDKDEGKALVCDASHTKLCLKFHLEPLHDNGILSR